MTNSTTPEAPAAPACVIDYGHTGWVLISSILVLIMIPGLALFEAGLIRRKNALSVAVQILITVAIIAILWFLFGYSLTFGPDHGGVIGDFTYGLMLQVSLSECNPTYLSTIPHGAFAFFQLMFAMITPLLMTGSYIEKMKNWASVVFMVLWHCIVYIPAAHIMWGHGFLYTMGAFDFAGGIVIHTTAGMSSLLISIILPKRADFKQHHGEAPPHNIFMGFLGMLLLWFGWFGFNGGSELADDAPAIAAVWNSYVAAMASALVWMVASFLQNKKLSIVALCNGIVAGLAGITPASGYVTIYGSACIGIIVGVASTLGVILFKKTLKIDDVLDVGSVHGITGIVGSLCIGFFATSAVNPAIPNGVFYSGFYQWRLFGMQVFAVTLATIWACFWTFLLLIFVRKRVCLSAEEQLKGQDYTELVEVIHIETADEESQPPLEEKPSVPIRERIRRLFDRIRRFILQQGPAEAELTNGQTTYGQADAHRELKNLRDLSPNTHRSVLDVTDRSIGDKDDVISVSVEEPAYEMKSPSSLEKLDREHGLPASPVSHASGRALL